MTTAFTRKKKLITTLLSVFSITLLYHNFINFYTFTHTHLEPPLIVGFSFWFLFCVPLLSVYSAARPGSNSSLFRNATSSEDLHNRLAGLKMEVTSRTSEVTTQNQSVVVKTTTVISQQASSNGITTNGDVEATQTTQQNASEQVNSELKRVG